MKRKNHFQQQWKELLFQGWQNLFKLYIKAKKTKPTVKMYSKIFIFLLKLFVSAICKKILTELINWFWPFDHK